MRELEAYFVTHFRFLLIFRIFINPQVHFLAGPLKNTITQALLAALPLLMQRLGQVHVPLGGCAGAGLRSQHHWEQPYQQLAAFTL